MESSSFWNPESTVLESGIQYPESGIHSMESRIQDCPGFPYMGRDKGLCCVLYHHHHHHHHHLCCEPPREQHTDLFVPFGYLGVLTLFRRSLTILKIVGWMIFSSRII